LLEAARELGAQMDLTAVNHWPIAIDTHTSNHPGARHLCASVDSLNPRSLYKEGQLDVLWASPECTHHSIARGGKPINDQSRASAWCVTRWAEALRPKVILVENVKEFAQWGPIGMNGRPLKRKKGDIFKTWLKTLESVGYRVEHRILCAADYGDPTTRRRLFIYATLGAREIRWPEATHSPKGENGLCKWISARQIIDWGDKGKSQRGGRPVHSIEEPVSTITTTGASAIVAPYLVQVAHGNGSDKNGDARRSKPVIEPFPTVAGNREWAVCNPYIVRFNGEKREGEARVHEVSKPLPNLDTSNRYAIAQPYLVKYYGSGQSQSTEQPLDTITTKPRFGLCQPVLEIDGEQYVVDILFRMLKSGELSKAQGFPEDYRFTGNTEAIVKQIGNAVPKNLAKALGRSAIILLKAL
jgi:DNA (cytosine-5)-methyltransferase 1